VSIEGGGCVSSSTADHYPVSDFEIEYAYSLIRHRDTGTLSKREVRASSGLNWLRTKSRDGLL